MSGRLPKRWVRTQCRRTGAEDKPLISAATPTLGLMMNWAMLYSAHTNGSWWAYFPVILTITFISSLNLMNTGLDQVFNPTLRD